MPSLGADMATGTLLEWMVAPGDRVHRGDLVAAVETEKSTIDVECFTDGVVERLLVEPGTTVAVGTPLAVIGEESPAAPAPAPPGPRATPPVRHFAKQVGVDLATVHGTGHDGTVTHADVSAALSAPTPVESAPAAPARRAPVPTGANGSPPAAASAVIPAAGRPRVTPYARRLARERGIDPTTLAVLGVTVRARDVPAAPAPRETRPGDAEARPDRMRAAIAALMTRSGYIPQYHVSADVELGAVLDRLHEANTRLAVDDRIVPAALLLRAAAHAARRVPELNGTWSDDRFRPAEGVDLGVVVSLRRGGLLVPTIADADLLDPPAMMRALQEVVERARTGRLRTSDTRPAGLTVTDLGDQGARSVAGVLFPPQTALVGFGTVSRRPWVVDDEVVVRPVVSVTLTGDHRASDGLAGARFLRRLDAFLHDPEEMP